MAKKLFIISIIYLLTCHWKTPLQGQPSSDYYPSSGDTVSFSEDDFFTFLWPKKEVIDTPLTFILVPLFPGQTPAQAIEENTPIYKDSTITDYYINYPWVAPPLDTGAYVWQISSLGSPINDPMSFIVFSLTDPYYPALLRFTNMYAYLKEKNDGIRHIAYDKWLYIHYKELYKITTTQKLRFRVLDIRRNIIAETNEDGSVKSGYFPPVPIGEGDNWVFIKLDACPNIKIDNNYTLEVWNEKGDMESLPFRCTSSDPFISIPGTNSSSQ